MARSFSYPATDFSTDPGGLPRRHGPYPVDSLAKEDTSFLSVSMTVEDWPADVGTIAIVTLRWSTGDRTGFAVPGRPVGRDRVPSPVFRARVPVPKGAGGKKPVTGGRMEILVVAGFRSAVSLSPG